MAGARGARRGRDSGAEHRRDGAARNQRGYVLLAALLALLAVSVLATAGFVVTRSDGRISAGHRATVEAREAARAGISRYVATHRSPARYERYAFGDDSAEVRAEPLVEVGAAGRRRLYRLSSRGVSARRRASNAERLLGALLVHDRGELSPPGTLSSGSPLAVYGAGAGSATVDGYDACPDPPGTPVAGVAVAAGGFAGDSGAIRGEPRVDASRSAVDLLAASGLDSATWAGLRAGSLVEPEREIPSEDWPADFSGWPVILVRGSAELGGPESGRGTLVVTGELALGGSFAWDGLVLVGGGFEARSGATVEGAVLAGLDRLHGTRPDSSTVDGDATLRYDSCKMLEASRRALEGLALRPGTRYEVVGG